MKRRLGLYVRWGPRDNKTACLLASAVLIIAVMPCLRALTNYIQTPLEWRVEAKGEEEARNKEETAWTPPLRPSPPLAWLLTYCPARALVRPPARSLASPPPSPKPPQTSSCLSLPPVLMPLNLRFRCATLAPQRMSMYSCHTVPRNSASPCPPAFLCRLRVPLSSPRLSSLYF